MPPLLHSAETGSKPTDERHAWAERRADFLVRMLQGTMALECQALPSDALDRLKRRAVELLLAHDE